MSPSAYLADLIAYALEHVWHDGALARFPIDLDLLETTFCQPFGSLPGNTERASRRTRVPRMCIEVVRRYLDQEAHRPDAAAQEARLAAEATILRQTYETLLMELGTSPDGIRAALRDTERRAELALDLGLDAEDLAALLVGPTELTATLIEQIFGFIDPARDPLADPAGPPALLTLRRKHLRTMWRAQESPPSPPIDAPPAVDPDLVHQSDIRNPVAGDPAFELLRTRQAFVDARLEAHRAGRAAAADLLTWFDAEVTAACGVPMTAPAGQDSLLEWAARRDEGIDVEPLLIQHGMIGLELVYLLEIRAMLVAGTAPSESEWSGVDSVLTQIEKRRLFPAWRGEEQTAGVLVGPDHFVYHDADIITAEEVGAPWRGHPTARRAWLDLLGLRTDVDAALAEDLEAVIGATEERILPLLRDAEVAAIREASGDLAARRRWVTENLLVDGDADGCALATRLDQAAETLRLVISGVQAGRLLGRLPDWDVQADHFSEEWAWLGSYPTWRSAMRVFLYPESALLPALRGHMTPAFLRLRDRLREVGQVTMQGTRDVARDYSRYLDDVAKIDVQATCQTDTRIRRMRTNGQEEANFVGPLLHLFGRGASGRLYWSTRDNAGVAGFRHSYWTPIPGLDGLDISSILGATAYAGAQNRRLFLFFKENGTTRQALRFTRLDLDALTWDEQPFELKLPEETPAFTAVVERREDETIAPRLLIQTQAAPPDPWKYNLGQLATNGLDWAVKAFTSFGGTDSNQALRGLFGFWDEAMHQVFVVLEDRPYTDGDGNVFDTAAVSTWDGFGRLRSIEYAFDSRHLGALLWENGLPLYQAAKPLYLAVETQVDGVPTSQWAPAEIYRQLPQNQPWVRFGAVQPGIPDLVQIPPHAGPHSERVDAAGDSLHAVTIIGSAPRNTYTTAFVVRSGPPSNEQNERVVPLLPTEPGKPEVRVAPAITAPITSYWLQDNRRRWMEGYEANEGSPASLFTYLDEASYFVPVHLGLELLAAGDAAGALAWLRTTYDDAAKPDVRRIAPLLRREDKPDPPEIVRDFDSWLLDPLDPHHIAGDRPNSYTRFTLLSLARAYLEDADGQFARDTADSLGAARAAYLAARSLLTLPVLTTPPPPLAGAPVPVNPAVDELRIRIDVTLEKLSTCRNLVGDVRPMPAPGDAAAPLRVSRAPTAYRYAVLVERARRLVGLAQQMEASLLMSLERRDAEAYTLLRARQDVQLSDGEIRVNDLLEQEAIDGVAVARGHRESALIEERYYQQRLSEGLQPLEAVGLELSLISAGGRGASQGAGNAAAAVIGAVVEIGNTALSFFQAREERRREWKFQERLAAQAAAVGGQEILVAQDRVAVARAQRDVAVLRARFAEAAVDFLANKFTNLELFEWMSGVFQQLYRSLLRQATSTARLAMEQLGFERQEAIPPFIQTDYWAPAAPEAIQAAAPDRRGLTGSARLLHDLEQLDQHAFDTARRKLQLSQTISLARAMPLEFQLFRETGRLRFTTPLEVFDRDFPGHYLRLIRRVRVSVVALIPPARGIRATLATDGVSRVVLGPPSFPSAEVRRPPESVALSSPQDASGLFELDIQPEMLLPFEGLGVDTAWQLELPPAANPFDFRTIADVLLTVEYTALHSDEYQHKVVQKLDRPVTFDRAFSFRYELSDTWYLLNNTFPPDPMKVAFQTRVEDFTPGMRELQLRDVTVYFARRDGSTFEVPVTNLRFTAAPAAGGDPVTVEGPALSVVGLITTAAQSGRAWKDMRGLRPYGDWELTLPDDLRATITSEVQDVLLVLTCSGRSPLWPGFNAQGLQVR